MMVKPSVTELLTKANNRYELVVATSKRARQISKGDTVLVNSEEKSPVTLAAIEISEDKVKQEERPLRSIPDSFKKIIIVKEDIIPRRNDDGILTIGLKQFLMEEQSLDIL